MSINELTSFQAGEHHGYIQGDAGKIELLTVTAKEAASNITAVICHPHPLQEGTMTNKVVTTLHRSFHLMGLNTVRFNFRGVGYSEGEHDHGVGESQDLLSILQWLEHNRPGDQIWLAGFSFGSYIAARVANQYKVAQLVSIAPPVHHYDYQQLTQINCPWLVIQGEQDEVVPAEQVYQYVENMAAPAKLIRFADTGHFFHGKLVLLKQTLIDELTANLP